MFAKATKSFTGYGISASNGEIIEIHDKDIFLDLAQAGFVEQIDRKEAVEEVKAEAKAEAKAKAKAKAKAEEN